MRDGQDIIGMGRGGGGRRALGVVRRRRGLFWALICVARGLGPPPPTRDDAAPCGGCILPACDASDSKASSAPMTSVGGGGRGDSHKPERVIVGRVSNVPDLEGNINIMHVFGWNLSSDDDIIHMCCNVILSLIIVIFSNPKVFIYAGWCKY